MQSPRPSACRPTPSHTIARLEHGSRVMSSHTFSTILQNGSRISTPHADESVVYPGLCFLKVRAAVGVTRPMDTILPTTNVCVVQDGISMRKAPAGTKCTWSVLAIPSVMDKPVHCVPSNTCQTHSRARWQTANVCRGFILFNSLSESLVRRALSTIDVREMVSIHPVDQRSNGRQGVCFAP